MTEPEPVTGRPQRPAMTTAEVDAVRDATNRVSCDQCGHCLYAADALPEDADPATFLADVRGAAGCFDDPRACPPATAPTAAELAEETQHEPDAAAPTVETATTRADMLAVLAGLRVPLARPYIPDSQSPTALGLLPADELPAAAEVAAHSQSETAVAARASIADVTFAEVTPLDGSAAANALG